MATLRISYVRVPCKKNEGICPIHHCERLDTAPLADFVAENSQHLRRTNAAQVKYEESQVETDAYVNGEAFCSMGRHDVDE